MDMGRSATRAIVLAPPRDVVEPVYPDADTTIPVFFGCDDKFLPHALTAIASVMAHASPANYYDIFIVQSGIPRERMDIAAAWMARYPNATLRFIDIDAALEEIRDDLVITRAFGVAAYFRIVAPTLFAKYRRIVYLDCDIVALGDVADYYRSDLGGMQVGGVKDFAMIAGSLNDPETAEYFRTQLGMRPGEAYFNSAQLVMDLEMMRREGTERKFFEGIRRIRGVQFPDQDVMNAVLKGNVKMLPCEWNAFDWCCDEEEEAQDFALLREESLLEIREARSRIKIIHFTRSKPWTHEYEGKNADRYWTYAAETPFYRQLLEQFRKHCDSAGLLRHLVTKAQEVHFAVKLRLVPREKKAKYLGRMRVIRLRRAGLAKQKEILKTLPKAREEA